ncbi:hypothetical protein R50073_40270 [Maricurvus nonylphenolicus]|uniref:AraC family transcriptional regulator n=1 Tax=Maricurvus nonylphenolicus TaxID=1008307 RepID=UPI0036F42F06
MSHPIPPSSKDYISSDYLVSFKDFCLSNGIDLLSVMTAIEDGDISPDYILSPPPFIDAGTLFQLYQHIHEIREDPLAIAWKFARWQSAKNAHGSLGLAIRNAENFIQSAELMIRFGRLRTDLSTLSLTIEEDKLFFTIKENNADLLSLTPEASQFIFSSYLLNAETFLRLSLPESDRGYPSTLYLKDKIVRESIAEADNRVTIIEGSSINALCIPLEIAEKRFSTYKAKVYQRFLSILEKELQSLPDQGFLGKLRSLITACDWHEVSIENLAAQLNLSVSTLQRRLRDEGTTFHDIKHQERVAAAKELLLLSQHSLETIADTLGYSNTSNFTKSFKTTEGCSPQEFRTLNKLKR